MQCQFRAMGDKPPISDTLPKRGRVNEVCREWLVHEDGALAYQLQKQEVERHLTNNKSRNAIVREDFPRAKDEQKREDIEALAKYHEEVHMQAARDARVAQQLAEEMAKEEERKRKIEYEDQRIARQIQEKEKRKQEPSCNNLVGDVNSVGLPLPELMPRTDIVHHFRGLSLDDVGSSGEEGPSLWPPPPSTQELDFAERTEQEKRDEELARLLQEEEESGLDMVDRDRLIAIEAQDKEFAKMLQEKEKAKARRARLKAKAKALARKQMEEEMARNNNASCGSVSPEHQEQRIEPKFRKRSSIGGEDEIEVVSSTLISPTGCPLPNIAMAIDPTYTQPRSSNAITSTSQYLATEYDEEEGAAPPYMPVQGQRRSSSLDKKRRKDRNKEGCKQQ